MSVTSLDVTEILQKYVPKLSREVTELCHNISDLYSQLFTFYVLLRKMADGLFIKGDQDQLGVARNIFKSNVVQRYKRMPPTIVCQRPSKKCSD